MKSCLKHKIELLVNAAQGSCCVAALYLGLIVLSPSVEAALSDDGSMNLQAGAVASGGSTSGSTYSQRHSSVGGSTSSQRVSSSLYKVSTGFLAASMSSFGTSSVIPPSDLAITILYAKTDAFGLTIPESTWQTDYDPVFIWETPTGPDLAGYSYTFDGEVDDTIDTTATSLDITTSGLSPLADGQRTFSIKAINTAGNAGEAISYTIWIDTTPPRINSYAPSPGTMFNSMPMFNAVVTDAGVGVDEDIQLFLNGSSRAVLFDAETGQITASGSFSWSEGSNSLELRVADALGNEQVPLLWSISLDTVAPTGSVIIDSGAATTASIYVTLMLDSNDATSGVSHVLISNDAVSGYVEEPFVSVRKLWKLNAVRGTQRVYVKFVDQAGNVSEPTYDEIELQLNSPETLITGGPVGFSVDPTATFNYMCPEGGCVFSYAFDHEEWSEWTSEASVTKVGLIPGNHYFRVKAARELNDLPGIQPDEEDPTPAQRTWNMGNEPILFMIPKGPPIKLWRIE